jgi:hypothetical protein
LLESKCYKKEGVITMMSAVDPFFTLCPIIGKKLDEAEVRRKKKNLLVLIQKGFSFFPLSLLLKGYCEERMKKGKGLKW